MRSNNPLVSIVIPSFQQASFLERSVRSVVEQQYPFIECFVEDGGSTDESVQILQKLHQEFPQRLHWVSERDGGQADAINKGFHKTSGEIVAYLNSDDEYKPGAIAEVVRALQAEPQRMWLTGDCVIIDEKGKEIQSGIRWYKRFLRAFLSKSELLVVNPIAQPATFWRKKVAQQVGPFRKELRYCMDYEYWLRIWEVAGEPMVLSSAFASFRIHGQSKGGSQFQKQFAEELRVANMFTSSVVLQLLHKLHVRCILFVYERLKKTL